MGYYSEVALIINREDYLYGNKRYNYLFKDDERFNLLSHKNADRIVMRDKWVIIYYESAKWYSLFRGNGRNHIDTLYDFLDTIEGRWGLIRIGEEVGDIELEGNSGIVYDREIYPISYLEIPEHCNDKELNDNLMEKEMEDYPYYDIILL